MSTRAHGRRMISRRKYLLRQAKFLLVALGFVCLSLAIGTWGYMYFARFRFVDAFLNASMILGGMGPVGDLPNDSAKWFASCYALFSGMAMLTSVAVILTPLVHRLMRRFHLDENE